MAISLLLKKFLLADIRNNLLPIDEKRFHILVATTRARATLFCYLISQAKSNK
jgi:hypothetical protein